jgi:predicted Fe-Mo cluster-binding NifX family protein
MNPVAFMTLLDRDDSVLSPHFGKAKWIAIVEADRKGPRFLQNTESNGRSVVDLLVANHCTDVVFNEIGPGALQHLQTAGIRAWLGPKDTPISQLLEMLQQGRLPRATEPHGTHGGHDCGPQDAAPCCRRTAGRQRCCATTS